MPCSGFRTNLRLNGRLERQDVELVAPGQLAVGNVNDIAWRNAEPRELSGDAGRLEHPLKAVRALFVGKIGHAGEAFNANTGDREVMSRKALRAPRPFIDALDRV